MGNGRGLRRLEHRRRGEARTVRTEARGEAGGGYKLGGELGGRRELGIEHVGVEAGNVIDASDPRPSGRCDTERAGLRHRDGTTPPLARREPVIAWVVSEMCERVLS